MNAALGESQPWSARRWAHAVLAIFLAQAGLVWLLSEHAPVRPPPAVWRTAIHLAADPWATKQVLAWPGLEDPTLFALPNRQGFSGGAWLTFRPMTFEMKDWTEPPHWLEVDEKRLGEPFNQFVRSNPRPSLLIADKPMPRSVIPDFAMLDFAMPVQSVCRIEGDLASRPLLEPIALPAWPHTDFLTNSIVQLLVDEEGYTFSTRLLGTSGLPEADQYAVKLATQARFQPLFSEGRKPTLAGALTWGKMVFQWHSLSPSDGEKAGVRGDSLSPSDGERARVRGIPSPVTNPPPASVPAP